MEAFSIQFKPKGTHNWFNSNIVSTSRSKIEQTARCVNVEWQAKGDVEMDYRIVTLIPARYEPLLLPAAQKK